MFFRNTLDMEFLVENNVKKCQEKGHSPVPVHGILTSSLLQAKQLHNLPSLVYV